MRAFNFFSPSQSGKFTGVRVLNVGLLSLALLGLPAPTLAQDAAPATEAAAPAAEAAAPAAEADPIAEADVLMKKRGVKNLRKAAAIYKLALDKDPKNIDLMLKRADALNGLMRVQTDGNMVLFDALSDSSKHKKIWKKHAPEALALAKKVVKARPKDTKAKSVIADAFIFHSSSLGILEALMKGDDDEYKFHSKNLIKGKANFEDGLGYLLMASFYTGAPWPISDGDKAVSYAEKMLKVKKSKRNLYYMAVVHHRNGDKDKALPFYKKALGMKCKLPADRDFCAPIEREIKRAIKDIGN
ncbi:MAG: tetratricopeptide repeat protein [Deltaproteobacteria bacterium]|nr:tetratricopeptide repeat protein [Deltaproteobacteria bacterium]